MSSELKEHLQGASPAHEPRQARHGAAAGYHADTHFPLRQNGFFAAGEAHVACKRKFTPVSSGTSPDHRNGHHWRLRETDQDVRPRLEACGTLGYAGEVLDFCEEIGMIEKETVHGAFKNDDPDFLVVFNVGHDFLELQNKIRTHEVERRVVEDHSPIGRRFTSYM